MAYQRPLVMVYQEYANMTGSTETTTLYPCIIGPCYHIIDAVADEELAYIGEYSTAGVPETLLPNNYPGAVVDAASVRVRIKDGLASLGTATVASDVVRNKITFASDLTFPDDIRIGDYVTLTDSGAPGADPIIDLAQVIKVDRTTRSVWMSRTVTVGDTVTVNAAFFRAVQETVYVAADVSEFTVDTADGTIAILPGLTAEVPRADIEGAVTTRDLVAGKVYCGYRALRQDLSEVNTVANTNELQGVLGKIDPDNPLGQGVALALANTTTSVKCISVDTDDVAGYTAAKDRLEVADNIYGLVPLTQESAVLNIFKGHAEQMSTPEVGAWRRCLGNTPLPTIAVRQEFYTDADGEVRPNAGVLMDNDDGNFVLLQDDNAAFLSNLVDAGDTVELTADGQTYTHTVAEVISEDLLAVTPDGPFSAGLDKNTTTYGYRVYADLDKTAQAAQVRGTSKSFGSSRFVHVWPDVCIVDGRMLPGFYLACAVAGMISGLPPHQGFTRLSIAGIEGVMHASDYFNREQLDLIADGGTFIFTQDNPSAPPVVRHQLTTDMSTVELRELSFGKNFDYVSYIAKDVMDRFLGQYNITPATLGILETALRAVLESLKLYSLPKIGSPVLDYKVTLVKQLDDIRDRVEMYAEIDFPYVLNTIGLHLISR